jgi:predicted phage terminase large subunit-like protein
MGSLDFAAQYQQEPVPPGGNLINWSWFEIYEEAPRLSREDEFIVSWDTAMSAGELSDYSVCVVLQVRDGAPYVLDVLRERLEYPDLRRKVIETHHRWSSIANNYALLIEDKGSGMSLIQDLRQEGIRAIPVKPEKEKILRMNAHTAKIEAGYVHLPRQAHWLEEFKRELMAFPQCKHNDQIDALSQALDRAFKPKRKIRCTAAIGLH